MSHSRNSRRGTRRAHAGVECWSARPCAVPAYGLGQSSDKAYAKQTTHRAERRTFSSATTIAEVIHEREMRELDEAAERAAAAYAAEATL